MELLIAGGDRRHELLCELARARGWHVMSIGLPGSSACAGQADIAVLPAPYAQDGHIRAPLVKCPPRVEELASHIGPGARVYCGSPDAALWALARANGWRVVDIYSGEGEFARINALASAEGAVYAAMRERDALMSGAHCMVVGNGRLGRALVRLLRGMGAQVCVAARRAGSRALAEAMGAQAVDMAALPIALRGQDVVFNTVPVRVLDERALAVLGAGALVVETASAPYGVDFEAARALGVRVLRESGIPGRYCPRTMARALLGEIEAAREAI